MTSDKKSVSNLVKICELKKIRHVVFSPGSRNAPLIISFCNNPFFTCLNITDERSAGFFALGMAQQMNETVIICCTSGSAAANYAPAIVEAYYQKIPLLILTADRPLVQANQREGQMMRQKGMYNNYIKMSFEFIEDPINSDHHLLNDRIINEAIEYTVSGPKGPVHVNIPLKEPLYNQTPSSSDEPKLISVVSPQKTLSNDTIRSLSKRWKAHKNILILCGQSRSDELLDNILDETGKQYNVVILSETTSNIKASNTLSCIDRMIDQITDSDIREYSPDLLITIGDIAVSKKIKTLLRKMALSAHWHIDPYDQFVDTYQSLTMNINVSPAHFFANVVDKSIRHEKNKFKAKWLTQDDKVRNRHRRFLSTVKWSDLSAFDIILKKLPGNSVLHMANSTAVRYVQLFDRRNDLVYCANRGVSGIDGCTSAAAGFAFMTDQLVTLITGDLAFFYDSNGLWHDHLSPNLHILLINNQGGNIFRFIPGPSTTQYLEKHFEARHNYNAEGMAKTFGLEYFKVNNPKSLSEAMNDFFGHAHEKIPLLEISTPPETNDKVLSAYFNSLKNKIL